LVTHVSTGTIVVSNGVSSAGKTSLARALLETLDPPHAHVSIDHFEGMARQRFRLPGAQRFYDECPIPLTPYSAAQYAAAGVRHDWLVRLKWGPLEASVLGADGAYRQTSAGDLLPLEHLPVPPDLR
jgi:chloramphenicol 3-O-phosphotransferase